VEKLVSRVVGSSTIILTTCLDLSVFTKLGLCRAYHASCGRHLADWTGGLCHSLFVATEKYFGVQ